MENCMFKLYGKEPGFFCKTAHVVKNREVRLGRKRTSLRDGWEWEWEWEIDEVAENKHISLHGIIKKRPESP